MTCPVTGCGKGPFADISAVRKHLRIKAVGHRMTEPQAWALLSGERGPQKKKMKLFDGAIDNAIGE